ncbi:Branched-chain amino acid transport system permease protein LivM [Candidatus Burkholderia verschuerenii]|uniref:Branched-chain amino acid transport system permease protein LivM n=1 Tax=Candidatus Burkholderia verschuerenii TaxID=242163 RepID=A0A0L0M7T2_9BURK|nr:hypothetical protein [Candidatus Burkholderia verschuerenii]KND58316.1 Branched-chain amino acid transport system permease protein LivM [Candidatus Burkholderia verschuerenii]
MNGTTYALLAVALVLTYQTWGHADLLAFGGLTLGVTLALFAIQKGGYLYSLIVLPLVLAAAFASTDPGSPAGQREAEANRRAMTGLGLFYLIIGLCRALPFCDTTPDVPEWLSGASNIGLAFLPVYRLWTVSVGLSVLLVMIAFRRRGNERFRLNNAVLNNAVLNSARAMSVGLSAFVGVLTAPVLASGPYAGSMYLVPVLSIFVICSAKKPVYVAIIAFLLGLLEAAARVFYPEMSSIVLPAVAVLVLFSRNGYAGLPWTHAVNLSSTWRPSQQSIVNDETSFLVFLFVGLGISVAAVLRGGLQGDLLIRIWTLALSAAAFSRLFKDYGILSFGHAMYFGVSCYATAAFIRYLSPNPFFGALAGSAVAGMLGLATTIRSETFDRQTYAMALLLISVVVYQTTLNLPGLGGEDGMLDLPRYFENEAALVWFAFAMIAMGFGALQLGARSFDTGNQASGLSFAVAAAVTGLAGSVKTLYSGYTHLGNVYWTMTVLTALTTVAGKFKNVGVVIAATTVIAFEEWVPEWIRTGYIIAPESFQAIFGESGTPDELTVIQIVIGAALMFFAKLRLCAHGHVSIDDHARKQS